MAVPSWSALAHYLDRLGRCDGDQQACVAVFRTMIAPFEIDTFACGKVHLGHRHLNAFYAMDWPESWLDFYIKSGLINRDPLIERLQTTRTPFTWSELRRDRRLSQAGSETLREAAERGWTEGLAVPVESDDPFVGMVSLVARRPAFDPDEKAFLTLLSTHFYQKMRDIARIKGCVMPPAGLTVRELESLKLVAIGCSDRVIGERLGISTATAHEHFEKAKKKLDATTRAEVIARAVSLAIIRIDEDRLAP